MTNDGTRRRGGSLATGLRILEAIAANRSLGVTEISRRVGADKANVHRLLQVLRENHYVEQDPASKEYRPTAQLVAVAGAMIRQMDVLTVVRPIMTALSQETGESVHLAVPTTLGAVYVAEERSKGVVSVETEIGSQAQPHCTATGKAIYAFLAPEQLHALAHDPLPRRTMRTIETVEALELDLSRVRERGYALDDEECSVGVRCIAAPLFGLQGNVVGSLGISGPSTRVTLEGVESMGALIRGAAASATRQLGGQVPWDDQPGTTAPGTPQASAATAAAASEARAESR